MKKLFGLTLFIVLALALSACGTGSSPTLTGTLWQWTAMQTTVPASQSAVPPSDVSKYTITFNTDGTADIKADCNNVTANYTTSGNDLTITLGASTLMYCGDASQDTIFLTSLGQVGSYTLEDGGLQLIFPGDNGKMDFRAGR